MSYNGIGLQTPRGSGTSGYVQTNLTKGKNEGLRRKREREAHEEQVREAKTKQKQIRKGAGTEIVAHDRKRWIEVKCMELRDKLEDQDIDDEVVEKRVAALRDRLTRDSERMENRGADANGANVARDPENSESAHLNVLTSKETEKSEKEQPKKTQKSDKEQPKKTQKLPASATTSESTSKEEETPTVVPKYVPRYADR